MNPRYRRILIVYWKEVLIRIKAFRSFILLVSSVLTIGCISLIIKRGFSVPLALYESLRLLFMASDLEYPSDDPYLQIIWIVFPLLGLIIIGNGFAAMGSVLKYGDRTTQEWNREMAKLMKNHIIIVGIGNVGLKVLKQMIKRREDDIVVIDDEDDSNREEELLQIKKDIPLIQMDATREDVLEMAGVREACCILLLIDNDLVNMKIALMAKKLNPKIRVVARMYDLKFGKQVKQNYGVDEVISTSSIAAPFFVEAIEKTQ